MIVSQDDLARVYVACRHAKRQRTGLAAADWWPCLLVLAHFTGVRRADLFSLRWEQIDLAAGTMNFSARKTGKAAIWPLHPVAVQHLERPRRRKAAECSAG